MCATVCLNYPNELHVYIYYEQDCTYVSDVCIMSFPCDGFRLSGTKTIKKNTNSTQNKSKTHHAKQYEVTSFLSTDCELSTETRSNNVYSLGPRYRCKVQYIFDFVC